MSTYFYTHFSTLILGTLGAGLSNFPWLSASILFPIGSAFVIPFFPDKGDGKEVRWFALSIALITFLITVGSYINGFDISNENVQLKENISWLPDLGLTWSVGADGMSMPLILLTSFITALAVLAAWPVKFKPKLFFFLILVMDGGQIAVFAVQDMLLFFLTWELELIPVYLLLAIWGGKNRQYAATKFIIYTAGSSIFILLAALAMGFYGTEIPVIAGVFLLKSYKNALFINKYVPGANIPENILNRLKDAKEPLQEGIKIAAEQAHDFMNIANGVHLMAVKAEHLIPEIIEKANLSLEY